MAGQKDTAMEDVFKAVIGRWLATLHSVLFLGQIGSNEDW